MKSLLTDEEKKAVEEFSHKIDVRDTNMILQYGAAAQKNVAGFSENALNNVRNKDLGEIGRGPEPSGGGAEGLRRQTRRRRASWACSRRPGTGWRVMKAQYSKVEANVEKISPDSGAAPDHAAQGCGHVRPDV